MTRRGRALVIDDKDSMRSLLADILTDFDVVQADSAERGFALLAADTFDVVLSDIRMPGADGFAVLEHVRQRYPDLEVLLLTAYGTVERAVEAMKAGAFDYLTKPFEPEEVRITVAKAFAHKLLRDQARDLRRQLDVRSGFGSLVGDSPAMQQVYSLIDKVAGHDTTVLVTGPSGTGKELVARAIHSASPRQKGPLIAINCGALPEPLLESELFGHVRGAFTGATSAKPGLLQQANGGTVFLDEINSLPLTLQVKLNRVLGERTVRRVGETVDTAIDVRVVAATNVDLELAVADRSFRDDLFYRLNVYPIALPPLSARREDIPALVTHFLHKHGLHKHGLHKHAAHKRGGHKADDPEGRSELATSVSVDVLRALMRYGWPGNVRELENVIERALILEESEELTLASLPSAVVRADMSSSSPEVLELTYREATDLARDRVSRDYLQALMESYQGNVTRAAERAGMERESLHRLLKRYGIAPDAFRDSE